MDILISEGEREREWKTEGRRKLNIEKGGKEWLEHGESVRERKKERGRDTILIKWDQYRNVLQHEFFLSLSFLTLN